MSAFYEDTVECFEDIKLKKKIWLMNHYATSQYKDRAGRHYWFAKGLRNRGYDVSVFCATTFLNSEEEVDTRNHILAVKRVCGIPFVFVKS